MNRCRRHGRVWTVAFLCPYRHSFAYVVLCKNSRLVSIPKFKADYGRKTLFQPETLMRQAVVLIGMLLILIPNTAGQNKQKPWLRGEWEGTGYQTDDNSTWAMKVTVKRLKGGRRVFSIDYPSLNCGGRLEVIEPEPE